MDLIIQASGGNPFHIGIGYFDSVLQIKEAIQRNKGIPVSKQTLLFNGDVLPDDLNALDSAVIDGSRIDLVIASDPTRKLRLIMEMLSEEPSVSVEVDEDETIQELKEKIMRVEGTSTEKMVVHANGKVLPDHKTIHELGLTVDSELSVDFLHDPMAPLRRAWGI